MKVQNETQEQKFKEIGAALKQAREEKSIRLEELALHTRIRMIYLQALENGKFEELPETIYVRGFIYRYGDAVGLDGKALAEMFSDTFQKEELKENIETTQSKTNFNLPFLSLFYIFLIVSASFGLFFVLRPRPQVESTAQNQSSLPVSSQKTTSKESISNSISQPKLKATRSQNPAAKSTVQVSLKLTGRSWMEVIVDNKTVVNGFMEEGQNQSWTAKEELTVRAGDAAVVFISKDDKEPEAMGAKGEVKQITFKPEGVNDTVSAPPQTLSVGD
ncbi:helix-turn-helix domain-containing protein [Mastigocoleus testarum]|uniref:Cytoskeleton protein RodZ-like C-terminal domain-containing protein n=1 Tax=Mastigocoleus testarum BC008 TaxID=371196 RepID=A0A0V7ZTY0_9CYAN|nr:RodZ domain-containing protein [Mastigocoleus testarum]KST68096.1 hypothetical protein BC008_00170 [Mastigocoleus testarum BC008]KST68103.1 hypothetical protein BC008_00205 [Mastigocoleus testarum BC008]